MALNPRRHPLNLIRVMPAKGRIRMVTTTIPLTLSLSLAFGIYMLAAGIALLRHGDRMIAMLDTFEKSPALTYVIGAFTYALGAAVIIAHHVWLDPLGVIVSLLGWIIALEGLLLIVWPEPLWSLGRAVMKPSTIGIAAIVTLVVGALLTLCGLTGTAGRL
jgi:hypothetical protein